MDEGGLKEGSTAWEERFTRCQRRCLVGDFLVPLLGGLLNGRGAFFPFFFSLPIRSSAERSPRLMSSERLVWPARMDEEEKPRQAQFPQ